MVMVLMTTTGFVCISKSLLLIGRTFHVMFLSYTMHLSDLCLHLCRFKITTEKPMGAIAGIQRVKEGPLEWSYHLPNSCQLSQYVM